MSDIGEYVCKLSNQLGQEEAMAKANVRKIFHAPVFTQKLVDTDQVSGKIILRINNKTVYYLGL